MIIGEMDRTQDAPMSAATLLMRAGVSPPERSADFQDIFITSVTDDSRRVCEGSCFVAVSGAKSDGRLFVGDAVAGGAKLIVAERECSEGVRAMVVTVPDARRVLAKLAAALHGVDPSGPHALKLIGVTGTNGKTTVAWLLRCILESAGVRSALLGTVEYDLCGERMPALLTTPDPVTLASHLATAHRAGATHAVLEVSSHALDQRRCDGLAFDAAVFTNLSGDHLDYHGSIESYFAAKRRLFEGLGAGAVAAINMDDPRGAELCDSTQARVVRYGIESSSVHVRASEIRLHVDHSEFVLAGRDFERSVSVPLVGSHNVENILAAAAAAEAMGVDPDLIVQGLERISGVPGRLERVSPPGGPFSVLVDYAHTDDALANVLGALRRLTSGRLICVFGCGGDRDRTKRPRMAGVVEKYADLAIATSDNPRTEEPSAIIDEILAGFGDPPRCEVQVEPDRGRAIAEAISAAGEGDLVLIAGKGHEDYQEISGHRVPFDDRRVARACLAMPSVMAGDAA